MSVLRVSDAEREAVVVRLATATAEGRLTLDEFEDRSRHAYAARTVTQLDVLVADIPIDRPGGHGLGEVRPENLVAVVAAVGGVLWMPLFPSLDYAASIGALGVAAGFLAGRLHARGWYRALAVAGIVLGSVGLVLQVIWLLVSLNR